MPAVWKKIATISNARVHIKRQSCSRSQSCNTRSIFLEHAPRAASTQIWLCPGSVEHGSNCLWRYFLTDDLLKSDKKRKKAPEGTASALTFISERDEPTISLEQRPKDLEIVTNYHDMALRSLEAWSTTAFLMDPDTQPAPILIKAVSTYNETRIESGPHPMGPPRRILAKSTHPATFGRPLWQVSRDADQSRGSGTSQREPSRGAGDQKGRQFFTPHSPTYFSCASIERGTPDAHPLGPTTTERRNPLRCNSSWNRSPSHCQSSPRSYQHQRTGSRTGKHQETVGRQLSLKSFFLSLRDSGSTETAVRALRSAPPVALNGRCSV